jgi:hypothetical protein
LADCNQDGLAIITFISTLVADFITHSGKPGSPLWGHGEALITAIVAAAFSFIVSYSPAGAAVERFSKPGFDDID